MPRDETPLIFDHDISGDIRLNGEIKQVWEEEALINSIKMWILSRRGDMIREPERGGYIIDWLTKSMNEDTAERVEMAIRDGIDQDFDPYLKIIHLAVNPISENRYWQLYMEVYSPQLSLRVVVDEKIKAKVN